MYSLKKSPIALAGLFLFVVMLAAVLPLAIKGQGNRAPASTMTGGFARVPWQSVHESQTVGPVITSVVFDGKKLTIVGFGFSTDPLVLINGVEQTSHIRSASDTVIMLRGKAKKLGLQTGPNQIQVADATGTVSDVFFLAL